MPNQREHQTDQSTSSMQISSRGAMLVLLCLAQLMVILDISAVNVALPDLAKDLRIGHSDLSWTITSYSLIFGSLLLLGGRAADLIGRRRVFLTGLGVFTAASLGSALAQSAGTLFAARAGQGLGAALLSPAALSIITSQFKGAERARALGVWGVVGGAGAAVGVLLGGLLTQLIDWRAIFLINLPIGLIVAAGVNRAAVLFGSFLLSSPYLQDVLGTSPLATGLAFLPYALVLAAGVHVGTHVVSERGVRLPLAAGFAIAAAGLFLLSGVSAHGSYVGDLLPGLLIAGIGIGVVLVSVAFSVLSGAREEETGMLSGLNTTGHEVGGSLGLAVLTTIAAGTLGHGHGAAATAAIASGIGNAFLAAGIIAAVASLVALAILPTAKSFLPRLELAPPVTIH